MIIQHVVFKGKENNGLEWSICQVFLDDILIFSTTKKNYEEHLVHLELVFERRDVWLNNFFQEVSHCKNWTCLLGLSHRWWRNLCQASSRVSAILDFPQPNTKKQLKSFIGTFNWLREYVPDAAPVTSVLTHKPFKWTEDDSKICEKLSEILHLCTDLYKDFHSLFKRMRIQ